MSMPSRALWGCAGLDEPDAGTVVRRRNTSVGFLAQAGALGYCLGLPFTLTNPSPACFPSTKCCLSPRTAKFSHAKHISFLRKLTARQVHMRACPCTQQLGALAVTAHWRIPNPSAHGLSSGTPSLQELHAEEGQTALGVVLAGSPAAAALRAHDAASLALTLSPTPGAAELAALARASAEVEALGGWEARKRALEALAELGIGAEAAERPVAALSGGQVPLPYCPPQGEGVIGG